MGTDSACMQIDGYGEGYPHSRKECTTNQETETKGFPKSNYIPMNMINTGTDW